jgi:hypothetical protein
VRPAGAGSSAISRHWCPEDDAPRVCSGGSSPRGSGRSRGSLARGRRPDRGSAAAAAAAANAAAAAAAAGARGSRARTGTRPRRRSPRSPGSRSCAALRSSARAGPRRGSGRPAARSGSSRGSRGVAGHPSTGTRPVEAPPGPHLSPVTRDVSFAGAPVVDLLHSFPLLRSRERITQARRALALI